MTRAIYTAAKDGKVIAQRDALIWVRLTAPGMYAVCGEADGEGVLIDGNTWSPDTYPAGWKEVAT